MAEKDQQGTGKHPHKSTEERHPHHEGKSEGEQRSASHTSHSGQEAHASGGSHSGHEKGSSESRSRGEHEGSSSKQSESADLKARESRDKEGNIHHHTQTAETTKEKGKGAGQ